MKILFIGGICIAVLLIGYGEVAKERRVSKALVEIVKLINFYDAQLNYRRPDFKELCACGKGMGLRYVTFDDGIYLSEEINGDLRSMFSEFVSQIGTTDAYGQSLLCKEYLGRFNELLSERRITENNKVRVSVAVSILSAVGVFITFI